jgi:galactokinase
VAGVFGHRPGRQKHVSALYVELAIPPRRDLFGKNHQRRIVMLVGGIIVLLLFGGSDLFTFKNIRDNAEEVIQDKDRAKQVVAITKQADDEYESFTENLEKLAEQGIKINQDYNVTREEVDALTVKADNNRKAFLEKYIELRFQVKDLVTAEEWQVIQAKTHD